MNRRISRKTVKVLLPKDEIRRRLTGEFATEVSDASGMLLLDVAQRTWSKELLSALELDESLLARCYESEDVTGNLTAEAAKLLGLSTDCVVVGGGRRLRRRGRRQRHRPARRAFHLDRHVRRDVRPQRRSENRSRGPGSHLLPRRPAASGT